MGMGVMTGFGHLGVHVLPAPGIARDTSRILTPSVDLPASATHLLIICTTDSTLPTCVVTISQLPLSLGKSGW